MRLPLAVLVGLLASCADAPDRRMASPAEGVAEDPPPCAGTREVVERMGERLKRVSLLAPESVLMREIQEAYAPLVTPELLEQWIADPTSAPGRDVSSPWP
jgi:hypothetical protein